MVAGQTAENKVITTFEIKQKEKAAAAAKVLRAKRTEIQAIMRQTGLGLQQVNQAAGRMGFTTDKTGKLVDSLGRSFIKTGAIGKKNLTQLKSKSMNFRMELLGIMFGFQMINKAVTTFFKNALATYDKVIGDQGEFYLLTNKLTASFEFLKFSIIDALSQSDLFSSIIDGIFRMTNALNEFFAEHPGAQKTLILTAGFIGLTAAVMATVGSMGLLWFSVKQLGLQTLATSVGTTLAGAFTSLTAAVIGAVLGIAVIGLFFDDTQKASMNFFSNMGKSLEAFGGSLKSLFGGDLDLAVEQFKLFFFKLLDATTNFAEVFTKLIIKAGVAMVDFFMKPFISLLSLIDKVTGSSYADAGKSMMDALKSNSTNFEFNESSGIADAQQELVDAMIRKREREAEAQLATQNSVVVGDTNIEINASSFDASQLTDSIVNVINTSQEEMINRVVDSANQ